MSVTIQLRRDLAASWTSNNPILAQGEVGVEYDTGNLKVGNGTSTWTELSYSSLLASDAITWTAPQTFDAPITQTPGQGANNSTPFAQYGDLFSDAIMNGLTTATSSTLTGTLAAGDAYVIGQRVVYAGGNYTVAASSTSYLDLSDTGVLTVSTSATVTANSLRLWQVTSSATAITGVTQVAPSGLVLNPNFAAYLSSVVFTPPPGFSGNVLEIINTNYKSFYIDRVGNTTVGGSLIASNTNLFDSSTLTGTTGGSIVSSMPQIGALKKFGAYANGYVNNSTTPQSITFPLNFVNQPVITVNTTGLSLSISATELTINAPNNTTAYAGLIIVEGF